MMHIKLFENFINENNDEDYFDGSKQIGKIKIEAGKWSGMGNDTRSPYMVKVYHFDCYGGEIWSSSQVREIKKENLEEFFNKVINQIEQDWKGKEDQIPTSCHADYWRNFLKEIPIEEVVEKLTTEDLYKLTYNVEEKYAEIFEEEYSFFIFGYIFFKIPAIRLYSLFSTDSFKCFLNSLKFLITIILFNFCHINIYIYI
jgi:hypothetical protein